MPSFISFRGRRYYEPSVVVDVNNNLITPEPGAKSLCVVGDFPEIPKGVPQTFGPSQQFEVPDSYPNIPKMLNYNKIFKNSIEGSQASADSITFVNVGANTAGTATIGQAAAGVGTIALQSKYFGLRGNDIQIRIEGPSTPAADATLVTLSAADKKYRVMYKHAGFEDYSKEVGYANQLNITYQDDNAQDGRFCKIEILPIGGVQSIRVSKFDDDADNALIEGVITAQAALDAKQAEIDAIDADDDGTAEDGANQAALDTLIGERTTLQTALTVATAARDAAIDVITRELADFPRNDDLATFITGLDDRLIAQAIGFDVPPEYLDNTTLDFADVANAAVSGVMHGHHYAVLQELSTISTPFTYTLDSVNGLFPFLEATDNLDGANPIYQRFTGGTQAAPTAPDFVAVLALLEQKDFTTMCVQSTSAGVHALVKSFNERSLDQLKERNYVLPAPAGQSVSSLYSTYVLPLNDKRFSIVGQKIDYVGADGVTTIRGTTEDMAFMMMCMQGAVSVATPLTLLKPNIVNVYQAWDRERDNDAVIRSGILAIGKDLAVARSVTSYVKDNLTTNTEMSAVESVDTTVRELRKAIKTTLGAKILSSTRANVKKVVNDALFGFKESGFFEDYQNVAVSIVDDTSFISFDLKAAKPHNFSVVEINLI